MTWSDGYIQEIEYTHGYYRELGPLHARFALLNRAVGTVDLERPAYLELGFGQGVSINIHAAASEGEYWATDFNPAQAASAQEMLAASGASAKLFDQSFAEVLERSDLPELDMIGLHGIWSWISNENRRAIIEIARRKLKPGGVFYISHNVWPGWSTSMPLRHLLSLHASKAGSDAQGVVSKIDASLEFAQRIADAGSLYFKSNPVALERLGKMKEKNRKYLAHEYFNAIWDPLAFSEVASSLEAGKLSFGVTAQLTEHLDGLHLTADGQTVLKDIADTVLRESVRDFLVNQQFRRDYFVRGPTRLPSLVQNEALRRLRFVIGAPASSIKLEVKGALGKAKLQESIYTPVIEALDAEKMRPKTLAELEQLVQPKNVTFSQLVQALVVLVGKGDAHPAQSDEARRAAAPRCAGLNRFLMRRSRASGEIDHLASPVTGGGVLVTRVEQLLLLARDIHPSSPSDWAKHVWSILNEQGQRMLKEGKPIEGADENLAELERQARDFESKRLPLLQALAIA